MRLMGRVALVTGGAHRVGKAIAVALAKHGAHVAIHYHGAQQDAEATVQQLRTAGGEAHAFQANLEDVSAFTTLITDVVQDFGSLDLLVNSAAMMQRTPIGDVTASEW